MSLFDDILGSDEKEEEKLELDSDPDFFSEFDLEKALNDVFDESDKKTWSENEKKAVEKSASKVWLPKKTVKEYYENRNKDRKKSRKS